MEVNISQDEIKELIKNEIEKDVSKLVKNILNNEKFVKTTVMNTVRQVISNEKYMNRLSLRVSEAINKYLEDEERYLDKKPKNEVIHEISEYIIDSLD